MLASQKHGYSAWKRFCDAPEHATRSHLLHHHNTVNTHNHLTVTIQSSRPRYIRVQVKSVEVETGPNRGQLLHLVQPVLKIAQKLGPGRVPRRLPRPRPSVPLRLRYCIVDRHFLSWPSDLAKCNYVRGRNVSDRPREPWESERAIL